jgi:hypothetical protein
VRAWGSLPLVVMLGLFGCDRTPPAPGSHENPRPSAAPSAPTARVTPAVTPAVPSSPPSSPPFALPEPARDFEDQFTYGTIDAGAGDSRLLATRPEYERYGNPRFGFWLDAPKTLVAMEAPTNGDGQQWRLGKRVAMTASGMYSPYDGAPECASSANVTGHRETKNMCWATGKRGGYIFWERSIVKNGVLFSLRFQYEDSLKEAMDPIVGHVNASWKQPEP